MTQPLPVKPLDYKAAGGGELPPQPLKAILLCLPGFICWWALFEITIGRQFAIIGVGRFFFRGPILICWPVAVITAIASLVIYRRTRKPWYVWINLIINISGLLLTLVLLVILALVLTSHGFE